MFLPKGLGFRLFRVSILGLFRAGNVGPRVWARIQNVSYAHCLRLRFPCVRQGFGVEGLGFGVLPETLNPKSLIPLNPKP